MNKKEQQIFDKFQKLNAIQPGAGWMAFNKERLMKEIDAVQPRQGFVAQLGNYIFNFRPMAASFCAIELVTLSGFGIAAGAKNSLPGDMFYSVKIMLEDVRIALSSKNKKSMLEMEYAGRRLNELCQLVEEKDNMSDPKVIDVVKDFRVYIASLNAQMTDEQSNETTEKVAYTVKDINEKVGQYAAQIKEAGKDLSGDAKEKMDEVLAVAEQTDTESLKLMASISATSSVQIIPEEELLAKIDAKYNKIDNEFTDLATEYQTSEAYIAVKACLATAEEYFNKKDLVKTLEIIEECELKLDGLKNTEIE